MNYFFNEIEEKWQKFWKNNKIFKTSNNNKYKKYYILDMFPYPSGSGLHVGHPRGYIASDIIARYKRHQGFNVLHPMGYDSFGLPTEQYAIETGQHPIITTQNNIQKYRKQLDRIGFSFDWSRQIETANKKYYKWTQWIFIQFFNSWYNKNSNKAESIKKLIMIFKNEGNQNINAATSQVDIFSAKIWNSYSNEEKSNILLKYRLAYLDEIEVNWCEYLSTVLANDEVINGFSERGHYPIVKKKMKQWIIRITAYSDRLLEGLNNLNWTDSIKNIQRNWIGKKKGIEINFLLYLKLDKEVKNVKNDLISDIDKIKNILWKKLKFKNYTFLKNCKIDNYIVDFLCLEIQLIIQIYENINQENINFLDKKNSIFNNLGYHLLIFDKNEIIQKTNIVLDKIYNKIKSLKNQNNKKIIKIFTDQAFAIFGVTYLILSPTNSLVLEVTKKKYKKEIIKYINFFKNIKDNQKLSYMNNINGLFTGSYALHPLTKKLLPILVAMYPFQNFESDSIMGIPGINNKDFIFAKNFNLSVKKIFDDCFESKKEFEKEKLILKNSDFLNGYNYIEANKKIIDFIKNKSIIGIEKTNYRIRDAVFSRQRYWGEPIPIYFKNNIPKHVPLNKLPLVLPDIEEYTPIKEGLPPLARARCWAWNEKEKKVVSNNLIDNKHVFQLDLNTMPGWAGSSWYFNRYMDNTNDKILFSKKSNNYWKKIDLYIGGSEHATGHLLYSRFYQKFLYDIKKVYEEEFSDKLINQGMILGKSAFIYKIAHLNLYVSNEIKNKLLNLSIEKLKEEIFILNNFLGKESINYKTGNIDIYKLKNNKVKICNKKIEIFLSINNFEEEKKKIILNIKNIHPVYINISFVNEDDNSINIQKLKNWRKDFQDSIFITQIDNTFDFKENIQKSKFYVSRQIEKMSKSKYNIINPDDICKKFGADTFRLYLMFIGPFEQSQTWNIKGIKGVFNFLHKFWYMYHNNDIITDQETIYNGLKILHQAIKKIRENMEKCVFNISVSTFMITVKKLFEIKCFSLKILEPLCVLISPYAPHIAEELWFKLHPEKYIDKNYKGISYEPYPKYESRYLIEKIKKYPILFNGKKRFTMDINIELKEDEIKKIVLNNKKTIEKINGKIIKNFIIIPNKIINLVF